MFGLGDFEQYQRPRSLRALTIALALLLTVALAWAVPATLLSPGEVIRGELEAAAAEVHATLTLAGPSATVVRRLGRHFPHRHRGGALAVARGGDAASSRRRHLPRHDERRASHGRPRGR